MDVNFDHALMQVLRQEGPYSNNPQDPGGETVWGLSTKHNPDIDLAALSNRAIRERYKRNYWDTINADYLPAGMDLFAFDMSVNIGPTATREILRNAMTLEDLVTQRKAYYNKIIQENPKMLTFMTGWLKRSEHMEKAAREYEAVNMPRFTQHMQVIGKAE